MINRSFKNVSPIELTVFLFSIMFMPRLGILDTRSLALMLFSLIALVRGHECRIFTISTIMASSASILLMISLLNFAYRPHMSDITIPLRYFRALLSIVCISIYIQSINFESELLLKCFLYAVSIHAVAILVEIVVPVSREVIYLWSGYNKKYLPLRASGLVSGYDFAGFFLNIGIAAAVSLYGMKLMDFSATLCAVITSFAIPFTSRVNIVVLIIIFVLTYPVIRRQSRNIPVLYLICAIVLVAAGSVFMILTIDIFHPLKQWLMQRFSWAVLLNNDINLTYSNQQVSTFASNQWYIGDDFSLMLGSGHRAPSDPGYINTIYETGIVGVAVELIAYINALYYVLGGKRQRRELVLFSVVVIIITLIMECKLKFLFSSGSFESVLVACLGVEATRNCAREDYNQVLLPLS